MDGLLFLATIIAVGLVMHWVVLNDRAGPRDATSGLFAIRAPGTPEKRRRRRTNDAELPRRRRPGVRDWRRR